MIISRKENRITSLRMLKPNMVDDLLAFYGEEARKVDESDDLQKAISLTKDNIKAIIMDVMFGGTDTVASAIEWVMAELMKSPEDQKKSPARARRGGGFRAARGGK
ncbi:hypothetical protein NC653_018405 [Populus alba x Populus x berolinensis]|uniref:Uncharacterized protein n=1 Tax=Populus alba x Populus x berolinensis TaxID=444605 RepID=A0AAD6QGF8_9ROSI|nr:hypothetical protein NC653_018405 [Populus alba x Populus x berolinensis]